MFFLPPPIRHPNTRSWQLSFYIYIYIYIHTHTHTHTKKKTCIYINMHIYIYTHTQNHTCIYINMHIYTSSFCFFQASEHPQQRNIFHDSACMHTYIHICIYNTHTHTHKTKTHFIYINMHVYIPHLFPSFRHPNTRSSKPFFMIFPCNAVT